MPLPVAPALGPRRYSAAVWQRFCQPRFAAALPAGQGARAEPVAGESASLVAQGCAEARAHQARVCFWLHYAAETAGAPALRAARFRATGCPTTIAVADFVAEALEEGRGPPELAQVLAALEIPEAQRHCVLLCEDAARAALEALPTRVRAALSPPAAVQGAAGG